MSKPATSNTGNKFLFKIYSKGSFALASAFGLITLAALNSLPAAAQVKSLGAIYAEIIRDSTFGALGAAFIGILLVTFSQPDTDEPKKLKFFYRYFDAISLICAVFSIIMISVAGHRIVAITENIRDLFK